jgi:integrase
MKIRFYLGKKSAQNKCAITCYLLESNLTYTLSTKLDIDPQHWDKKSQRAVNYKTGVSNILKGELNRINIVLDALENKLKAIGSEVREKEPLAGFDDIKEAIIKHFNKKSLYDIYDDFMLKRTGRISPSSMSKYKRLKGLLKDYEKDNNVTLNIKTIAKKSFLQDFFTYMIEKKDLINSTAYKEIQFLKAFLNWAYDYEYHNVKDYEKIKRIDLIKETEEAEVIYLSEKELMQLYNLDLEEERLKKVRDVFVFQCFTGVRYSDIEKLSREDIRDASWHLRTQKTRQIIQIPLTSYALSILERYRDNPQPLPVISNQKMNKYLKDVCEKAKINQPVKTVTFKGSKREETVSQKFEKIGTHTARRTFVSLSLQKGMKPELIMKITGHTTFRMMQKYLKIDYGHLRDEMDKVWGTNLRIA